jgi:O-antigen/teichoic acid export membrane protein
MFVLLGGAGLSALLASKGFWAAAAATVLISLIGYWFFRRSKKSSKPTNSDKKTHF